MFKSATAQLTLWYLAMVMVISIGFSIAIYHFATGELTFGLHSQTQRIFREYPVFNNDPFLREQGNDISEGARHIFWRLAYFNVLVLVGAGFASYWLARRTLVPIEAAHERQKRFTADVSHELRTPLTSLKMSSEVALMDKKNGKKELQEALQSNLEDASKMEALINNILQLTKLDADAIQEHFAVLQTSTLVQGAIAQVQKQADAKNIQIVHDITDHKLFGNAETLSQLLVILLDNAIKYSPKGTTVEITAKKQRDSVLLAIKDHGHGIKAEALPHVFDRFYRQDTARQSGTNEGYGIGLSIAKLIADHHQADIILTSQPGKGTTATVSLRIATKA